MFKASLLVVALSLAVDAKFFIPHSSYPERGPIVNLFQWSYRDIKSECEFLKLQGYGGVQVSPVTENIEVPGHPWTEKYEPISYKINSSAGDENEFKEMIDVCSDHEINIYVEVVLNHMTKTYPDNTVGYAKSVANTSHMIYPEVPYKEEHFHTPCKITDEDNLTQVLNCELNDRHDLNQKSQDVRATLANFLNKLINYGVAGFSINAAGYMSSTDLLEIFQKLDYLSRDINFKFFQKPFIYHEVLEKGAIRVMRYTDTIDPLTKTYYRSSYPHVTDFEYGLKIQMFLDGRKKLSTFRTFNTLVEKEDAVVFIDNHLTQRGLGYKGSYLTYKSLKEYRLATAFMLTLGYGIPVIMSGYNFDSPDQGPPSYADGKLKSVETKGPEACKNGWTCEHRDKIISKLVKAANMARYSTKLTHWWDNGENQIAFHKGSSFFVFNLDQTDINQVFQTGLPVGHYCDVFTGESLADGTCSGTEIYVYNNGTASILLKANDPNGAVLLYDNDDSHIPFGRIMDKKRREWAHPPKELTSKQSNIN